jgi:superfamily II DNA/RNA helicase
MNSFSQLQLDPNLAKAVAEMGYESMTPIQAQAIPVVLSGQDVMGAAQTGTGKTAAFSLPLLQRMIKHENGSTSPARHPVRALVLLPTRELADQVAQQVKMYAKYTQLRSAVVFGGMDMKPQTAELKRGVEVLVATPGRLLDHIEAKTAVLNQVEYVVLDEADRMLDIGFLPDLQRILSYLPKQRTTLLFSATFSPEIKRLAASYLQNPVTIEVARPNQTASTVTQLFFNVAEDDKRRALKQIVKERDISQAFVFVNSKLGCARLARALERDGLRTAALHGDKSQDERLKALEAFKKGEVDLLICTDVAARGLDIKDVPAVFNIDIPYNAEDYIHRIGRTGRAGAEGLAVSFASPSDQRLVTDIEKLTKQKIELLPMSFEDERPRGRSNPARRQWDDDASSEEKPARSRFTPAPKVTDPFFDKPYEASETVPSGDVPSEATVATVSRGISPNIKPKRKVAALFKTTESL